MDLFELTYRFPTHQSCIEHLEKIRWAGVIKCPYCYDSRNTKVINTQRHHCNSCNSNFSVLVGTIFHNTKLDLRKWFYAICIILNSKKGISSLQLARNLKINKDTAWSLQMRIRRAMKSNNHFRLSRLAELTDLENTMINSNLDQEIIKNNQISRKQPSSYPLKVVEKKGNLVSELCPAKSKKTRSLKNHKLTNSTDFGLMDGHFSMLSINDINLLEIEKLKKSILENKGNENYWISMKRGLLGQYHKLSDKHLPAYVDECKFKYNQRGSINSFRKVLQNLLGTAPAFIWEMEPMEYDNYYSASRKKNLTNPSPYTQKTAS